MKCSHTNRYRQICTYLEMIATHTMSPLLHPPSTLREVLENIKRGIAEYSWLVIPNDLNEDIWIYK